MAAEETRHRRSPLGKRLLAVFIRLSPPCNKAYANVNVGRLGLS